VQLSVKWYYQFTGKMKAHSSRFHEIHPKGEETMMVRSMFMAARTMRAPV